MIIFPYRYTELFILGRSKYSKNGHDHWALLKCYIFCTFKRLLWGHLLERSIQMLITYWKKEINKLVFYKPFYLVQMPLHWTFSCHNKMSRASVKFFCVTLSSIRTVILEIKRDKSLYNAMAAALTYSLNNLKLARLGLSVFTRRSFRNIYSWVTTR